MTTRSNASRSAADWVLFVNAPIGLVVAALATRVLPESQRRTGRFDLPGAITATLGVAALVYGLSNAAASPNGASHWGDTKVIASLAAAAVLLVAFAVIEMRSRYALLPIRVLRSREPTSPGSRPYASYSRHNGWPSVRRPASRAQRRFDLQGPGEGRSYGAVCFSFAVRSAGH